MRTFTFKPQRVALWAVLGVAALQTAHATNGYFPHGFGIKAMGMGGPRWPRPTTLSPA